MINDTQRFMEQTSGLFNSGMAVGVASSTKKNRSATRYVFCAGNHLVNKDARQLGTGVSAMGGAYVSTSQYEGCPTLWRTGGIVYKCAIVPLETTAIPKHSAHRSLERQNETYIAGTNIPGFTVYAADDMGFLMSDAFKNFGIVEIPQLEGMIWDSGLALQLQKHFFPQWDQWLTNDEMPVLLTDIEEIIRNNIEKEFRGPELYPISQNQVEGVGEQMLESVRLFRVNGLDYIERNRQAILSRRSADTGGFYIGWTDRARVYAKQLGIALEDENKLVAPPKEENADLTKLVEEMRLSREQQDKLLAALISIKTAEPAKEKPAVKYQQPKAAEPVK